MEGGGRLDAPRPPADHGGFGAPARRGLTLRANGKTLIFFFVIKVYHENLGHMQEPLVPSFVLICPSVLGISPKRRSL